MAEHRRPRSTEGGASQSDEPSPKKAAHSTVLSQYPAAACLRRRPFCVGRFAGPRFSDPSPTSYTTRAAADPNAKAFSLRSAFAKVAFQQHKKSQAAAGIGSSERVARISGEITEQTIGIIGANLVERVARISGEITEQTIGIIGAGMAGLYSALILDSLGFTNYAILEANPDRVGGRVFTRYFDGDDAPPSARSKWNYIDLGAMRFPCITIMDRVIGEQPWSLTNYLNSHTQEDDLRITLLPYHLSVDNNIQYYNSTRKTNAELGEGEPDPLRFGRSKGGGLDDNYVEMGYPTWLDPAFDSFKEKLHHNFDEGFQALLEQDLFSVRAYLRPFRGGPDTAEYPQELIDYLETLDSATGHYDDAFTEAVMDSFDFHSPTEYPRESVEWKCVEGGTSQFADAMHSVIKSKPEMNKRVTKIAQDSEGGDNINVFVAGESQPRTYDHVINTLPPAVLRSLDTAECNFSYEKRTALRVLRVDSSIKIGLLFKSRWWQDKEVMRGKPMRGGQSSTDLPIRTIVYPSYGIDDPNAPGVLIASYTWGQDAARLSALAGPPAPPTTGQLALIELAISNIATVHDLPLRFLQEQYTGQYFIQDWDQYEYSQGAFALFGPGQFMSTFPRLIAPEMNGRYHTAGEMSSVHHAWIVGALNSAWRCVYEILKGGPPGKIQELKDKWGELEKVDMGPII